MIPVSSQTIRTGDLALDQRHLEDAQRYANANGLVMQVRQLPQGGFQVDMVRPAQPPAPMALPAPAPMAMQGYGPPPPMTGNPAPIAAFNGMPARAMTPAGTCQACGRHAPTKQVTFHQNIGALIIRFPKRISGQLCRNCIGTYFQKYTLVSLLLGWWGLISFFYTLVTIPMNIATYFGARSLPRQ